MRRTCRYQAFQVVVVKRGQQHGDGTAVRLAGLAQDGLALARELTEAFDSGEARRAEPPPLLDGDDEVPGHGDEWNIPPKD